MNKTIFREYDIRGVVDTDFMISETDRLANAIGFFINEQESVSRCIIIGRDARQSSPLISEMIKKTLSKNGFSIIDIGIVPSPVAYFAHHYYKSAAVLMITASHNPPEYNGIKIVVDKTPIWGKQIQKIYAYYQEQKSVSYGNQGKIQEIDAVSDYINYMVKLFPDLQGLFLPVVFECAYATAGVVLPSLIEAMQFKGVCVLHSEVGLNPLYPADPVVEKNMIFVKEAIIKNSLAYGIGFDGDADRMCVMSDKGRLLSGDLLLALFIKQIALQKNSFKAVCNVTMSQLLFDYAKANGVDLIMVPTGHAIIEAKMREYGALVGGESSCHFFFKDNYFGYDDGIYAALRFIQLMVQSKNLSVEQLVDQIPQYYISPEYRIACADEYKFLVIQDVIEYCKKRRTDLVINTIDGVRIAFNNGWAIVRAANTQPVLSIRCEGITKNDLLAIKKQVGDIIKASTDIVIDLGRLLEGQ